MAKSQTQDGVLIKCVLCGREFRVTKRAAQNGVINYAYYVKQTSVGGQIEADVSITFKANKDLCPKCANTFVESAYIEQDYQKCDFILRD